MGMEELPKCESGACRKAGRGFTMCSAWYARRGCDKGAKERVTSVEMRLASKNEMCMYADML